MHVLAAVGDVASCSFTHNTAGIYGGGLFVGGGAVGKIGETTFDGNSATFGGALAIGSSKIVVSESAFATNVAFLDGGGMYVDGSDPDVSACVLTGNTARRGGGVFTLGRGISDDRHDLRVELGR